MADATITFIADVGTCNASAVTDKQGLPMKYSNFLTSGISIKLGDSGEKNIKYELKSQ